MRASVIAIDERSQQLDVGGDAADPLQAQPPDLTVEEAQHVAESLFGIAWSATPLDSERDQNFRIGDGRGESFVLKISNPADDPAVVEMQTEAILHIARTDPALPVPRVCPTLEGGFHATLEGRGGRKHMARMITFLEGRNAEPTDFSLDALHDFGSTVARMGRALRGFFHPAAGQVLLWDVKHAARLRPLLGSIEDPECRALVARVIDRFEERVLPAFAGLRAQVIHNDLTLDNVLVDADGRVTGIVDFGDMANTALVCDLAVSLAELLRGGADTFEVAEAVIRGYSSLTPLEDEEAALLADMIAARLAANAVISAWRVRRYPENAAVIMGWDATTWPVLELFEGLGPEEVHRRFREACAPALTWRAPASRAPASSRSSEAELAERRRRLLGSALSPLSYHRPLHLVRGQGLWIFDSAGRRYLDAYNNVPVVGHCHPRVVEAIANQARTLNTNTRYLHEAVLELAERLTATMPDGLDTCMFVNSGSEANDLAWRLATAVTGGEGGIVTAHAYHGVTAAIADLSPEEWPEGERPAHVETVPAPDGYRGPHRRDEPGWAELYAAHVEEAIAALNTRGLRSAAVFVDSAFTSDGVFTPPSAYLQEVLRRIHEAGGLFVADEVQAGFGRFGSHLWSFQASGVTPDIVTLGKPMGNGHPVAAVLSRAEIVDEFARRTNFFSTFGGNPVACAVALAVLDVIDEEGLQEQAAEVGARLKAGLDGLTEHHPLIGEVRGAGLLIGVDIVCHRETREPAPRVVDAVVNGMRDHGVLIGSTGPNQNVLKVRPPLVFTREDANLLVGTLDRVLATVRE